jgi:hypothetical protein
LKNRKQVWEIIELQEGEKDDHHHQKRKKERKQREGGVTSSSEREEEFWVQTPTDSEHQKASASIHFKRKKEGRKSHPIEEQKLCVIFKSLKPPPNKPRPQKRAFQ